MKKTKAKLLSNMKRTVLKTVSLMLVVIMTAAIVTPAFEVQAATMNLQAYGENVQASATFINDEMPHGINGVHPGAFDGRDRSGDRVSVYATPERSHLSRGMSDFEGIDASHLVSLTSEDQNLQTNGIFEHAQTDVTTFNIVADDFHMTHELQIPMLTVYGEYALPYNAIQQQRVDEAGDNNLQSSEYFLREDSISHNLGDVYLSATQNAVVTFTYRGNGHTGGTVPANHSNFTPGLVTARPQGTMVRAGHVFIGWRDTFGTLFTPGTIIPANQLINFQFAFQGTVILEAHWEQAIVTFQYRSTGHTGGTVPLSQSFQTPGSVQMRPQGTLRRAGYVLAGWRDTQGMLFAPGTVIPLGQSINFTHPNRGTVIFDAHWIPANVRIEYRGNGNTGGSVPLSHTIRTPGSTSARAPGNLARTGYVFYAWRTSDWQFVDPGMNIVFNTETEGTLALYAHWIPTPTTFTRFFDSATGVEFRVSQQRFQNVAGFTNVYVGMASYFNSQEIDVSISRDGVHWQYIGWQIGWGGFPTATINNPFTNNRLENFMWQDLFHMSMVIGLVANDFMMNQLFGLIHRLAAIGGWNFNANFATSNEECFISAFEYLNDFMHDESFYKYSINDFMTWCEVNEENIFDILSFANAIPWNAIDSLSNFKPAFTIAITAMKATVATAAATFWVPIWGQGAKVAALAAVTAVAITASIYASHAVNARSWANTMIAAGGISEGLLRNHTVYILRQNSNSRVFYVGRTENFEARRNRHNAHPGWSHRRTFTMMPLATGLTLSEARRLEQALIVGYTIQALDNKINSIAPWRLDLGEFSNETQRIIDLFSTVP